VPASREAFGAEAVTDENGTFTLQGLLPDVVYSVDAEKVHYTLRPPRPKVLPAASPVRVVMRPLARWKVTIVDAVTGDVVPNALLVGGSRSPALVPLSGPARFVTKGLELGPDQRVAGMARDDPDGLGLTPDVRVRFQVFAPNYHRKEFYVEPRMGEDVPLVVKLDPVRLDLEKVRLGARLSDGSRYTGTLEIVRSGGIDVLRFVDGIAQTPIRLPPGEQRFGVRGGHAPGTWWRPVPGGADVVVASGESAEEVHWLDLRGARIALTVTGSKGERYDKFDLDVIEKGRAARPGFFRSFAAACTRDAALFSSSEVSPPPGPFLFLHPGEYELVVNVPGRGYAKSTTIVEEGVTEATVDLHLQPGSFYEVPSEPPVDAGR